MKVRIISLFLSVAFLSILTFEYIDNTMLSENSSAKTIENILEKRLSDKSIDDTYLLDPIKIETNIQVTVIPSFKQTFYTFKSTNTLFKPPIA